MSDQTMTKEEIIQELQRRHSMKYLSYLALQEIMLDYYQDTTFLKNYDHDLTVKFKNMVSSLQRNSSAAYRFMQSYSDGDATIKQFHSFVRIFEALHKAIDDDSLKYARMLDSIDLTLQRYGLKQNDNLPIENEPATETQEG